MPKFLRWSGGALLLLITAISFIGGCGASKEEESDGGGGGGEGGGDGALVRSDPDIPAPPRRGQPLTDNWDLGEINRAKRDTTNNLRQIVLALHSYHDMSNAFPAGIFDKSGQKIGLSWRVAILPFIEQDPLYKQFKLDEPWDSPHNKKLIKKMPRTFAISNTAAPNGYTYYRGFTGAGILQQMAKQGEPGRVASASRMADVVDGTSNTLLVAEVDDPVIWTKPEELHVEAESPQVPRLGGVFKDGFHGAMGDGAVRWFKLPMPDKTIRHLIMRNDGNAIDLP